MSDRPFSRNNICHCTNRVDYSLLRPMASFHMRHLETAAAAAASLSQFLSQLILFNDTVVYVASVLFYPTR